jgi:glycosyltransferase involved in cell wall biosynthesis
MRVQKQLDATSRTKISVCIPTYRRPELLRQAIKSLETQTRPPDELIVVWREGDVKTEEVLQSVSKNTNLKIVPLSICQPGFLPPIRAAIDYASSDVLAFLDDDAAAFPDWVARMERHYCNTDWAAVGGRIVTVFDGVVADYPIAKVVGRLNYGVKRSEICTGKCAALASGAWTF